MCESIRTPDNNEDDPEQLSLYVPEDDGFWGIEGMEGQYPTGYRPDDPTRPAIDPLRDPKGLGTNIDPRNFYSPN